MSILIKGMEMPKDRLYPITVTIYSNGDVFNRDREDKNVYKAIPVPWQIASSVPETNISHWMPIVPPKEIMNE